MERMGKIRGNIKKARIIEAKRKNAMLKRCKMEEGGNENETARGITRKKSTRKGERCEGAGRGVETPVESNEVGESLMFEEVGRKARRRYKKSQKQLIGEKKKRR